MSRRNKKKIGNPSPAKGSGWTEGRKKMQVNFPPMAKFKNELQHRTR